MAGKLRLGFLRCTGRHPLRHVAMAHTAANMAGNSRAAGQAAIPSGGVFQTQWIRSMPGVQILAYTWTLFSFYALLLLLWFSSTKGCLLSLLNSCFCYAEWEFLLIQLVNGTAVRWQMTPYLNEARERISDSKSALQSCCYSGKEYQRRFRN